MANNCVSTFVAKFFTERYILLKDDWLSAALSYLKAQKPQINDPSKVASLVFEQWKFANIADSSYSVFASHSFHSNTPKTTLKNPIVCQINSIVDIGSSFYSQYCQLNAKTKVDRSGFDTIFGEKDDDINQKSSRMLRLTLSDGESELKAIELFRISKLSLLIKPGCKLLIAPPVVLRRGTFLLRPENCQILGGECLPQLNENRPLDVYTSFLGLDSKEKKIQNVKANVPSRVPLSSQDSQKRNFSTQSTAHRPSTSFAPSTSEDALQDEIVAASDGEDSFENFDDEIFDRPSTSVSAAQLTTSRRGNETIENSRNRRRSCEDGNQAKRNCPPSPKRRSVAGMLSSCRKVEEEERMEVDEEPIGLSKVQRQTTTDIVKSSISKIKEEDDDIQFIELHASNNVKKQDVPNDVTSKNDETSKKEEDSPIVQSFKNLHVARIDDAVKKMRYCIGSRKMNILAIVLEVLEPLRIVDDLWTMKVRLQDDSISIECLIDNSTLYSLIGLTCQEAVAIRQSSDIERRRDGSRRLKAVEQQLLRLDLLFEIEFFNIDADSPAVIRNMRTLAQILDSF